MDGVAGNQSGRDTRPLSVEEARCDVERKVASESSSRAETCKVTVKVKYSKFPDYINSRHLRQHFLYFKDHIVKAEIVRDHLTKKSKGSGCITFSSKAVAVDAVNELEGSKLQGKFKLVLGFEGERSGHIPKSPQPHIAEKVPFDSQPALSRVASTAPTKVAMCTHMPQPSLQLATTASAFPSASLSAMKGMPTTHATLEQPAITAATYSSTSEISVSPTEACQSKSKLQDSESSTKLPQIVIRNLNPSITESQIKATLLLRCGVSVASCIIKPGHEMCTAIVELIEPSKVTCVIEQLNGQEILGSGRIALLSQQLNEISLSTSHDTQTAVTTITPPEVISLSTGHDTLDSQTAVTIISPPEVPSGPSHKWRQPMSLHLYQFITRKCPDIINHFEQNGGMFTYTEGFAVIAAPTKLALSRFFHEVVNNFEELTMTLKSEQWDRLMAVSPQTGTSLFSQLFSFTDSPNVQVYALPDQTAIVFMGTRDAVQSAHKHLTAVLNKELYIDRLHLQGLLYLSPQLHMELSRKYGVKVTGFHKDSTVIKFDGSSASVSSARQEVDHILSKLIVQEVPFQYPMVLVDSLRKRFCQEDVCVSLDQPPEVTTSLRLYSLSQTHLNHALRILEGEPFKSDIHFSQVSDLTNLVRASNAAILKKGYIVSLEMPSQERGTLIVYGFDKKDVQLAHRLLETVVDSFTVKTVPLQCTPQKMAYFKHLIVENPTQEVKSLLETISPHVQVSSQEGIILLSGTSRAIQRANTQILQSRIFQGVLCTSFPFNCHSDFLPQIEQYIVEPLKREGHLDVLFTCNKSPHAISAESHSATFSISIFSKKSEHLAKASSFLQALDPQTKSFRIHPKALPQVKKIANFFEEKFQVRITHHSEPTATVVIHGLCASDAEGCWREIDGYIKANLIISKQIQVNQFQAKYLHVKHSRDIQEIRQNCEIHSPHAPVPESDAPGEQNHTIDIKGKVRHVELATERIRSLCSSCQVEMCQLECPTRHLRVWRKRWEYLKKKYEEKHDLVFDFKYNEPTNGSRRDESTTLVAFFFYGSDHSGIAAVKERILTQDNGQSVEEKQIQLSDDEVATVLSGLQRNDLNPEKRYCIILDTNRESQLITLTAPVSIRSRKDLLHAERDILRFIDEHLQMKKELPCGDLVVSLVLRSKYLHEIEATAKRCQVFAHFQETPQPVIELQGSRSNVRRVEQKVQSLFKQIPLALTITHDKLVVSSSFLPVFHEPDFAQFNSKLQEELCVACFYPKPRKILREVVLQSSPCAHTITFQICSGYLVTEEVDAIVNTADRYLLHHSGLAKAIADAGGRSIHRESDKYIQKHGRLNPGDAVCLGSGDLPCSRIIHTVDPVLSGAKEEVLHTTYFAVLNSLECANRNAISSIALPAFGADIFGIPSYACANAAVKAVRDFCQKHPETRIKTVRFLLYNTPTVNTFVKVFDTVDFSGQSVPAQTGSHSAMPRTAYKWFWQKDQHSFSRYSQDIEKALTAEYRKSSVGLYHCWIGDQYYEINFQTMTQKNTCTAHTRKIRKELLPPVSASLKLPSLKQVVVTIQGPKKNLSEAKSRISAELESSNIVSSDILLPSTITSRLDMQLKAIASKYSVSCEIREVTEPCTAAENYTENARSGADLIMILEGHINPLEKAESEIYSQIDIFLAEQERERAQYPPEWEQQSRTVEVPIQPGTAEWKKVSKQFKSTIGNARITRIKRIQNRWLWERYVQHRTRMHQKNAGRVHERELFHGTSNTKPEVIYMSEEGFDMRFSRDGFWGQANYFAVDAWYSDQFAHQRGDGQREILLAKVLTGDSCLSAPDSTLRMPPRRNPRNTRGEVTLSHVRYDTVTGYIQGSQGNSVQVYMTYSNEKAYPAYLIRYC